MLTPRSETKQGPVFSHCSWSTNRKRKDTDDIRPENENLKFSLFGDDMI
jgi:hypothetical protein